MRDRRGIAGTVVDVIVQAAETVIAESATNLALLPNWLDPVYLLTDGGPFATAVLPAILIIVFIETGLLFPLLPGDSLLFTGGLLAAQPNPPVSVWVLVPAVAVTAIAGDQCAYWIGRKIGPALFKKEDSRLFKQKYVTESHAFFEKYGPATIILARFVPIARTFTPVLAGVSKMTYSKFLAFDIAGGILWGGGVTILGYFLGNVAFIRDNIEAIFLLIVFVSILPGIIEVAKRLLAARKQGAAPEPAEAPLDRNG